jgi:TolA-binding protein
LEQHDLRPNAGYYLAWVSLGEKKPADAARQFGGISEQFPEHQLAADARLQQAIVLGAAQEYAQAQQALELFLKAHPKHEMTGQAYYQLGSALMEQKQWPAAIEQFSNVPAKNDWRDDALYRTAWCERRAGNKPKAIPFYKELLEQFGESNMAGHALLELVELEYETGQFDPAIARLGNYLKTNPAPADDQQAQAMYWLGWCLYGKKETDLAKAQFAKLKELFPESLAAKAPQPKID